MNVILSSKSAKYLKSLNEPFKSRIKKALNKLELEPPQGDIKNLVNQNGYRLRIGGFRVLFSVETDVIVVTDIAPRGQIYKGR